MKDSVSSAGYITTLHVAIPLNLTWKKAKKKSSLLPVVEATVPQPILTSAMPAMEVVVSPKHYPLRPFTQSSPTSQMRILFPEAFPDERQETALAPPPHSQLINLKHSAALQPLLFGGALGSKLGGARFFRALLKLVAVMIGTTTPPLLALEVVLPKIPRKSCNQSQAED